MKLRNLAVLAGLVAVLVPGTLLGQKKSDDNQPEKFKAKSELVLVPVTVTKGAEPVRGLTKDNFILEEDGKPQNISVFEGVSTEAKRIQKRPQSGKQFDNLSSDETPRAMMLVVIDAINTPFGYQEAMRKDLLKFLAKNLVPNQVTGVVVMRPKGITIIRDFTGDTQSLIATLQSVSGEMNRYNLGKSEKNVPEDFAPPGLAASAPAAERTPFNEDSMAALKASVLSYLQGEDKIQSEDNYVRTKLTLEYFQQIARGLEGYPGRKAMLWASTSFPQPFDPQSYVRDMSMMDLYERTLKLLANANVVVYPIDAKGLQGTPIADATLDPYQRAAGVTGDAAYRDASRRINTFRDFAESTGGKIYFDVNNNDKAFQDAAEDSQAYYMLGYYLEKNPSPGWHKLKVKLKNADGKVRSRNGYYVSETPIDPEVSRKTDLAVGSRSPFDYTGIRLAGEWLDTVPAGKKRTLNFHLHILPESKLISDMSNPELDLDIVAVARKADTSIAGQSAKAVKAKLPPGAVQQIVAQGIDYKGTLEVDPGDYEVRILVRDNITGRMGSVLTPVSVK